MKIPTDVLIPRDELSREIGLLVAGFEDVRKQTVSLLMDLSAEELSQRAAPSLNQIGSLAIHLAKNEFWWIHAVYAGRNLTDEERRRFYLDDDTLEADFTNIGFQAEDCIRLMTASHDLTLSTLAGVSDSELENVFPHPSDGPGVRSSLRWILHHLIDHEANHKGQISMLKRLIRS